MIIITYYAIVSSKSGLSYIIYSKIILALSISFFKNSISPNNI